MTDRTFGPYPGMAIVGGGLISALYGVAGDGGPGVGLQHCFAGDYRRDGYRFGATFRTPVARAETICASSPGVLTFPLVWACAEVISALTIRSASQ